MTIPKRSIASFASTARAFHNVDRRTHLQQSYLACPRTGKAVGSRGPNGLNFEIPPVKVMNFGELLSNR